MQLYELKLYITKVMKFHWGKMRNAYLKGRDHMVT